MKQHFNPFTMANELLMLRSQHRGSFLLVEGDTDCRFFSNFIDGQLCRIVPAFGSDNVMKTLDEIRKRKANGVLGIIDSDYWVLEGFKPSDDLIVTETHDLETMILVSPALEKVLKEYLPGDKLTSVEPLGQAIRQSLLSVGIHVGYLRWVSHRDKLYLSFDSLPFKLFVDEKTLVVDIALMIRSIRAVSKIATTDKELREKMQELAKQNVDPWQVCQGHDLVCLLEIVMPVALTKFAGREIAEAAKKKVRTEVLDKELRVAYERAYFINTQLCTSIQTWESRNQPYKVLRT